MNMSLAIDATATSLAEFDIRVEAMRETCRQIGDSHVWFGGETLILVKHPTASGKPEGYGVLGRGQTAPHSRVIRTAHMRRTKVGPTVIGTLTFVWDVVVTEGGVRTINEWYLPFPEVRDLTEGGAQN